MYYCTVTILNGPDVRSYALSSGCFDINSALLSFVDSRADYRQRHNYSARMQAFLVFAVIDKVVLFLGFARVRMGLNSMRTHANSRNSTTMNTITNCSFMIKKFEHKAAIRNCIRARIACGDVASERASGTFVLSDRSEASGGCRFSTRLYGSVFLLRCTCVSYAYVRGLTNMSQLRWCYAMSFLWRVTMILLKPLGCAIVFE